MITSIQRAVRDDYGILQFSRPSTAYDANGRRYDANNMRFEPGKYGMAARVEEGTVNHFPYPLTQEYIGGALRPKGAYYTVEGTKVIATAQPFSNPLPGCRVNVGANNEITVSGYSSLVSVSIFRMGFATDDSAVVAQTSNSATPDSSGYFKYTFSTGTNTNLAYITIGIGNTGVHDYWLDKVQVETKPCRTTFVVGKRKPELLTIPTSVPDALNPTNLATENQSSAELDTTGFTGAVRDNTKAWHGTYSLRVEAPSGTFGMTFTGRTVNAAIGETIAISLRRWNPDRSVKVAIYENNVAKASTASLPVVAGWTEVSLSYVATVENPSVTVEAFNDSGVAHTFWIDGYQINKGSYEDWCPGGHRLLLGPSEGTIEGWIYADDYMRRAVSDYAMLWHLPIIGGMTNWALALYQLASQSKYYIGARQNPGDSLTVASIDYTAVPDGWHRFGLGWGSGNTTLCVDGVELAQIAKVPGMFNGVLAIGSRADNAQHANALHDDIRLSSIKRSAAEQLALYNSGQPAPWDEHTTYLWRADGPSAQRMTRAVVL